MLLKRWFYKTFRWTPEDFYKLPLDELDWLPLIESAEVQALEFKQEQYRRTSTPAKKNRTIQGY